MGSLRSQVKGSTVLVKDLMRPGLYFKGDRSILLDEPTLKRWVENYRSLSSAGYKIPVWYEHPAVTDKKRAYPVRDPEHIREVESDPLFAGWVEDITYDPDSKVVSHAVRTGSDELARKLTTTGTFVSPQFGKWVDEDGKEWDSCVHHVALTTKPVAENQNQRFTWASSLRDQLSRGIPGQCPDICQLSLGDSLEEILKFALQGICQMGYSLDHSNPEKESEAGMVKEQKDNPQSVRESFVASLENFGILLKPDSPLMENPELLGRLVAMIAEHCGRKAEENLQQATPERKNPQTAELTMPMSQNDTPKPDEAERISQLQEKLRQQESQSQRLLEQNRKLRAEQFSRDVEEAKKQVKHLLETGRCNKVQHDRLLAFLGGPPVEGVSAIQFSDDDSHQSAFADVLKEIRVRGENPEGTFFPLEGRKVDQFSFSNSSEFFQMEDAPLPEDKEKALIDRLCPRTPVAR